MIAEIIIAIVVAVLLLGMTTGMVKAMQEGRFSYTIANILHFCLLNGFLAACLEVTILKLFGVDVGLWQVVILLPVTIAIYYSVLRGHQSKAANEAPSD